MDDLQFERAEFGAAPAGDDLHRLPPADRRPLFRRERAAVLRGVHGVDPAGARRQPRRRGVRAGARRRPGRRRGRLDALLPRRDRSAAISCRSSPSRSASWSGGPCAGRTGGRGGLIYQVLAVAADLRRDRLQLGAVPGRTARRGSLGRPRRRPADAVHPDPAHRDRRRAAVQPGDPRHRPVGSVEVHGAGAARDQRAVHGRGARRGRHPPPPVPPTPGP